MKKLLLFIVLLPTLLFAQDVSYLNGKNVNIDAEESVQICTGTGDVKITTGCTGGGTQYDVTLDATDGSFDIDGGFSTAGDLTVGGTLNVTGEITVSDNIIIEGNSTILKDNDTGYTTIAGGTSSSAANGGALIIGGNSSPDKGDVIIRSGNAASSDVMYYATNATSRHRFFNAGVASLEINTSDQLLCSDGTNSLPSISFLNDPDTGFYSSATNQLSLSVNGAETFRFNNSGHILGMTTGNIGWTAQSAANQACATTCVSGAVFGFDSGTGLPVGPNDATADTCICAGPS